MLDWQLMGNCQHFSNFSPHLLYHLPDLKELYRQSDTQFSLFPLDVLSTRQANGGGDRGRGGERWETKTNILDEVSPVVRAVFLLQTTSPRNVYKMGPGRTTPTTRAVWTILVVTVFHPTSVTFLTGSYTSGSSDTPSPSYLFSSPSSSSCTSGRKLWGGFNSQWNKKNQNLPRMKNVLWIFCETPQRPPLKRVCKRFTSFKCLDWQVVSQVGVKVFPVEIPNLVKIILQMKVCRICDQGNFTNFIYWEIFIDQRVYEAVFLYLYICQRDEMSPSQDPPQPLPQRPDG